MLQCITAISCTYRQLNYTVIMVVPDGYRQAPHPRAATGMREMIVLTLKVLCCLALSGLMLVPVTLYKSGYAVAPAMQTPNVDAQAMWSRWERR